MQPRSRTRCRDPPPPPPGRGRHRRRSPSPRHQRRPPPPQRRSPDRRRYQDIPIPDPGAADRRSVLLEAGRLAAHYLVAQGVIPDHLLRAREDPNHATVPRPEPPAPPPASASYGRKRDQDDEDPRWRRAGDWGRAKGDDDRQQSRRSGWDRRTHSFDERRKYDVDRGARRTRDYDEPKRPPMSRSYSHNDRRPSGHPKRTSRSRSRSRSRTKARSYHHGGSRRDSDGRPTSRLDLDHANLPHSGAINLDDAEMPRKPKVSSSILVADVNDLPTAIEDGDMDSEIVGLDHAQHVSEQEDGQFAENLSQEEENGEFAEDASQEEDDDGGFVVAGINDEDGAEMDVTERQPYDVDVYPSQSVDEPAVHMQSQLSNVEEGMQAGTTPMDASMLQLSSADKDGCSQVANLDRDEQELPFWYRIFDLNIVQTPEGCEMPQISGDPPADHVCSTLPDLAGQMNQQAKYGNPEIQGQDEHAGANHLLEYGHDLSKYDLNNVTDEHAHDDTSNIQGQDEDDHLLEDKYNLNKCDLNHEEAHAHSRDNHLLGNEEIRLNRAMAEHDLDNCRLSNEQMLLKKNADERDHDNLQMENERMLVDPGASEQGLDTYHVSHKQFTLSHATDEQVVSKHQLGTESVHLPMGVHDVDSYNMNSEQMLLNNVTNKYAEEDTCHLKDGEAHLDQAVDGQAKVHSMGNGRTVPVIDLEDDYKQQPDTREFLESISDQETSSFSDNPHTNIQEVSSSITPNFGNRCTGRGAANLQAIPGDDDALYVAFDKIPLEVINVWDLPSSELGKSS